MKEPSSIEMYAGIYFVKILGALNLSRCEYETLSPKDTPVRFESFLFQLFNSLIKGQFDFFALLRFDLFLVGETADMMLVGFHFIVFSNNFS